MMNRCGDLNLFRECGFAQLVKSLNKPTCFIETFVDRTGSKVNAKYAIRRLASVAVTLITKDGYDVNLPNGEDLKRPKYFGQKNAQSRRGLGLKYLLVEWSMPQSKVVNLCALLNVPVAARQRKLLRIMQTIFDHWKLFGSAIFATRLSIAWVWAVSFKVVQP